MLRLKAKNIGAQETLTEICVSLILKLIRTGQIPMGSRVSEVLLSRRLKFGRAPVRALSPSAWSPRRGSRVPCQGRPRPG